MKGSIGDGATNIPTVLSPPILPRLITEIDPLVVSTADSFDYLLPKMAELKEAKAPLRDRLLIRGTLPTNIYDEKTRLSIQDPRDLFDLESGGMVKAVVKYLPSETETDKPFLAEFIWWNENEKIGRYENAYEALEGGLTTIVERLEEEYKLYEGLDSWLSQHPKMQSGHKDSHITTLDKAREDDGSPCIRFTSEALSDSQEEEEGYIFPLSNGEYGVSAILGGLELENSNWELETVEEAIKFVDTWLERLLNQQD
jgi:hypothetical protein